MAKKKATKKAVKKKAVKKKGKTAKPKKYDLETPIVKAYIEFCSLPFGLRAETEKTQEQFLENHGLSKESRAALYNYEQIIGFWTAVRKNRKKYIDYENANVDDALYKITQGVQVQEMKWNNKTKQLEPEVFELPPNVKAIELHKKVNGEYEEKLTHKVEIDTQRRIIEAAKKLDEDD